MKKILLFLALVFFKVSFSQSGVIDVEHYKFDLVLSDANDSLHGKATIKFKTLIAMPAPSFDLAGLDRSGKGMLVESIFDGGNKIGFKQADEKLVVLFNTTLLRDEEKEIVIHYKGVPKDGLIISKNKYGDRTFFADNWPNRAHSWIPCNDVPSDKASVEFIITAPRHYQVISNGVQIEERNISEALKRTHWREDNPIPTKVMVIGAARFAVRRLDSLNNIPVTAWVYPQDSTKGFYDYALAVPILKFFSDYIGPYPYQKLANVQSKTIFGGMENASAIFYAESSVTGNRSSEDLLAHEIAHQWFGNTATEKSFPHLWLSEGFATYLTDIYIEQKYGKDSMNHRLQNEKAQVLKFAAQSNKPVVDTVSNLMELLNANSYQKGAWVLHMLRSEVGDSIFHQIIKTYYQQYKNSNADTRDIEKVAETISGKDLKPFFDQWLYQPGLPELKIESTVQGEDLKVKVTQGEHLFKFHLHLLIQSEGGGYIDSVVYVEGKETVLTWPGLGPSTTKVIIDPDKTLLFIERK